VELDSAGCLLFLQLVELDSAGCLLFLQRVELDSAGCPHHPAYEMMILVSHFTYEV